MVLLDAVAVVIDIFSLLTAAAGWYYLFYSGAARRLRPIESHRINLARVRLRRVGGVVMLLLGGLFFAGFQEKVAASSAAYIAIWLIVLFLLLLIVVLALIDLRLTWALRRDGPRGPRR